MRYSKTEFRSLKNKTISLIGMSGVGKTRIASMLRQARWFHYSADYRISTRYLDEAIMDNIKRQAMDIPLLRTLLSSDTIRIENNTSIDNLEMVSSFLGRLGDPEKGGLGLQEFKRRQALHCAAESGAMKDLPDFVRRARNIYHYPHVINDTSGSLCELDEPAMFDQLASHSLILYIKASAQDVAAIMERARTHPKPLYFREDFLTEQLDRYLREQSLEFAALIDPDHFQQWLFPHLFAHRLPRYEAIVQQYGGYVVHSEALPHVQSEADFLDLVEQSLSH